MPNIERNEIVIEIDHQRVIDDAKLGKIAAGNSPVYFYPLDEELRSRIIPQRSPNAHRAWMGVSSIPGQRVHVDTKAMRWRVTDALDDPENKLILQQVVKTSREAAGPLRSLNQTITGGVPEKSGKLNTPEELHNWLYWMRRLVDAGHANVIQGRENLPSEATLRNGGDIRIPGDPRVAKAESGSHYMKPDQKPEAAAV